jgi:hypothetical protein
LASPILVWHNNRLHRGEKITDTVWLAHKGIGTGPRLPAIRRQDCQMRGMASELEIAFFILAVLRSTAVIGEPSPRPAAGRVQLS